MAIEETRIEGLDELYRTLQDLPVKIERNVVRGALRAGAVEIRDTARSRAPVLTGALRDSIRVSMRVVGGKVVANITAGGKPNKKGRDAYYAHMVEFGTKPHDIKPKNRKSLFVAGLFKEIVHHQGAKARPFLRPAFDGKWRDAVEAAADYMRARIPRELEKQGR